ncbi:MAG: hypothetical protein JW953_04530 [Anaerolineae bacterium]|nr:hypothetical protein [Anaerolineae bacterium]
MDTCPSPSLFNRILRNLPAYFSSDWITLFLDLYQIISKWFNPHRREGIYEILDYDSTLELLDTKGKTALFKKRQKVKFIQNHILAFEDYAWGDGEIFADYQCSPGVEVDRYQEGDRWNILISLRETKNSGNEADFYIERTAKNGFTKVEESFQSEIRHRTKRLRMRIIFPKNRRCQKATLVERSHHRTKTLGPEHFVSFPDGRQMVTWETEKVRRFEVYTIKWYW